MVNPNIAYKDKDKKSKYTKEITFKSSHVVRFTCPHCGHDHTSTAWAGMVLCVDNLVCANCHKKGMDFKIDP